MSHAPGPPPASPAIHIPTGRCACWSRGVAITPSPQQGHPRWCTSRGSGRARDGRRPPPWRHTELLRCPKAAPGSGRSPSSPLPSPRSPRGSAFSRRSHSWKQIGFFPSSRALKIRTPPPRVFSWLHSWLLFSMSKIPLSGWITVYYHRLPRTSWLFLSLGNYGHSCYKHCGQGACVWT